MLHIPIVMPTTCSPKRLADVGAQGEEFFGGQPLVGEAHHVVQDRRDGGVASESHFGDHDSGHGRGMRQQGAAVIVVRDAKRFPSA